MKVRLEKMGELTLVMAVVTLALLKIITYAMEELHQALIYALYVLILLLLMQLKILEKSFVEMGRKLAF